MEYHGQKEGTTDRKKEQPTERRNNRSSELQRSGGVFATLAVILSLTCFISDADLIATTVLGSIE